LRNQDGSISIDWIEMSAGSLAIGVIAIFVVLQGSPEAAFASKGDRLPLIEGPALLSATSDAGTFHLTDKVALPVGTLVVHSDSGFTSFRTPDGGWVDAWSESGDTIPEGAVLSSTETFTLSDGSTMSADAFSGIYTEAYSSAVRYSFQTPQSRS